MPYEGGGRGGTWDRKEVLKWDGTWEDRICNRMRQEQGVGKVEG